MRKFFAGLGVALIGVSSLAAPVGAQQPPVSSSVESVTNPAGLAQFGSSPVGIPDIAYAIFPWLVQPGSPAPVPAPAATPVLRNCAPHVAPEVRPGYIILFCGDAHSTLGNITWNSWGLDGASGQARLGEKTCNPSCATGGFNYRYVNFHLGGIEWRGGEPRFTRAYIEGREYMIG